MNVQQRKFVKEDLKDFCFSADATENLQKCLESGELERKFQSVLIDGKVRMIHSHDCWGPNGLLLRAFIDPTMDRKEMKFLYRSFDKVFDQVKILREKTMFYALVLEGWKDGEKCVSNLRFEKIVPHINNTKYSLWRR